ncbi:hypothetical protein [Borrelia sp. RT1S]|nr:hypothetical protein [Borrelia sp. RT1S]UGQ17782.1 hypothetical protein LSO05_04980 [Borrelia sp. RT1S]
MDEVEKERSKQCQNMTLKDRLLVFCTRKRSLTPSTIRNNDRLAIGLKTQ